MTSSILNVKRVASQGFLIPCMAIVVGTLGCRGGVDAVLPDANIHRETSDAANTVMSGANNSRLHDRAEVVLAKILSHFSESARAVVEETLRDSVSSVSFAPGEGDEAKAVSALISEYQGLRKAMHASAFLVEMQDAAALVSSPVQIIVADGYLRRHEVARLVRTPGSRATNQVLVSRASLNGNVLRAAADALARSRVRDGEIPSRRVVVSIDISTSMHSRANTDAVAEDAIIRALQTTTARFQVAGIGSVPAVMAKQRPIGNDAHGFLLDP
jgi:hypothetical protein